MNLRELTDEELNMVEAMGATGFSPSEIAEVLLLNADDVEKACKDPGDNLYKRYRKGYLEQSLKLRQRIFKDAANGSSPAQTLAKKILDDCAFKQHINEG
jgi:hypothetical protein